MTGSVTGIRRRRGVAGRRETPHLPLDRDFYGQTLYNAFEITQIPTFSIIRTRAIKYSISHMIISSF